MVKTFEEFANSRTLDELESLCNVVEDKYEYLMELKNKDADTNPDVAYHSNPKIAYKILSMQKDLPQIIRHCKEFIKNKGTNKSELDFYFIMLDMYNDQLGDDY
jgi:hypothetical protein